MEPWVIFGVLTVLVVGGFAAHHMHEKRVTEAWRKAADDLGLAYLADTTDALARFGRLKTFQLGHSQKVNSGIRGDAGDLEITLLDYQYSTGHGKHRQTHRPTLCVLRNPALGLPACSLRPQNRIGDFFGKLFGRQDIDFADDPRFSAAYVLQGDQEGAIRDLFTPECREWFAGQAGKNFHFECAGDLFLFHTGKRLAADKARQLMEQAMEILHALAPQGKELRRGGK